MRLTPHAGSTPALGTMFSEDTPIPQRIFKGEVYEDSSEVYALFFERNLKGTDLDPNNVRKVADLGCGTGVYVSGALAAFPKAEVHAVDYHDILYPHLKQDSRITFHQGRLTDELAKNSIPECDVVLLSNISHTHRLSGQNIHALKRIVKGILITAGDNADLEETNWFQNAFTKVKDGFLRGDQIWKANLTPR